MNDYETLLRPDGVELAVFPFLREGNTQAAVYLHGIESHAGWFSEFAQGLAESGIDIYCLDRRGAGHSSGDVGHLDKHETALADIQALRKTLIEKYDRLDLIALSWGARLALSYVLFHPYDFKSVSLIAPGLAAKVGYGLFDKIKIARGIFKGDTKAKFPIPIKPEMFTNNPKWIEFIKEDEYKTKAVSAQFLMQTLRTTAFIRENAWRLKTPTHIFFAGKDAIIDNEGVKKLVSPAMNHIKTTTYDTAAHSLMFECPDELKSDMVKWIKTDHSYQSKKRFLIVGAGAVGSCVGGTLAIRNHDVTLLCREAHANAIRENGLKLNLNNSIHTVKNCTVATTPEEVKGPFDATLVCVKNHDTYDALFPLKDSLGDSPVILTLQNGVCATDVIKSVIPNAQIVPTAFLAYVSFLEAGCIERTGHKYGIVLGGVAKTLSSLRDAFLDAGWPTRISHCASSAKWSKLLLNVWFNAISAAYDCTTEEILANKKWFAQGRAVLLECVKVMKAEGVSAIDLPGYPVKRMIRVFSLPTPIAQFLISRFASSAETGGRSSMWQDLKRGRGTTEIDALNGEVVRLGIKHNIPTPANASLCEKIKELTKSL